MSWNKISWIEWMNKWMNEWMKEWVALIEWNEKTWHETKWNEHEHEMTWTLT